MADKQVSTARASDEPTPDEPTPDEPMGTLPLVRRVQPALEPLARPAPTKDDAPARRTAPEGNVELVFKAMHRNHGDEPAPPAPPRPQMRVALQPFRHRPRGQVRTMSDLAGHGGLQRSLRERAELREAQRAAERASDPAEAEGEG
jgi:hypothetical protein